MATSAGKGGFEIHVDPTDNLDIGKIVMGRERKSRSVLDGMRWAGMGKVVNTPK